MQDPDAKSRRGNAKLRVFESEIEYRLQGMRREAPPPHFPTWRGDQL